MKDPLEHGRPRGFDFQERVERDYRLDDAYWDRQDELDRHAPAPDTYIECRVHGLVRGLTGCPRCAAETRLGSAA